MALVVRRISRQHNREAFDCGKEPLTRWFRKSARANDAKGHTRTWVLVDEDEPEGVIGYFSLCASAVAFTHVPDDLTKHLPRYSVPAVLLARLALDEKHHGKGLGSHLLIESFRKALEANEPLGVLLFEVDALDDEAKAFYERYGFRPSISAEEPMKLFLSMETVRAAVRARDEAAAMPGAVAE